VPERATLVVQVVVAVWVVAAQQAATAVRVAPEARREVRPAREVQED
jgi:hypothetical protein